MIGFFERKDKNGFICNSSFSRKFNIRVSGYYCETIFFRLNGLYPLDSTGLNNG